LRSIIDKIPKRALFAQPLEFTLMPNGEAPGIDGLPEATLNAIPGFTLGDILSYIHPRLPDEQVAPGGEWRTEMRRQDGTGTWRLDWTCEHIRSSDDTRIALLRVQGYSAAAFSLEDAMENPVTAGINDEVTGWARLDMSRHQIKEARYSKRAVLLSTNSPGAPTSTVERVRVKTIAPR
jgi:hypothetical protein